MASQKNLTEGRLGAQILAFSLPLMLSNVLQILFNMADIAVVGRFAGSLALAAVGSTTLLISLFTGILIGLSSGINVVCAFDFGAKDRAGILETTRTAFVLAVATGFLIFALGTIFAPPLLRLIHTKGELVSQASRYVRIYFFGMPALAAFNFGNAVFSAGGNTKKPLRILTFAGILNVFLNLFFVLVCKMNVEGVALASAISQYVSAILALIAVARANPDFLRGVGILKISHRKTILILRIGIPAAAQNAIFCFANLFIQVGVNSFDAITVAGNSAAANSDPIIYNMMGAFHTACGSFIGQNFGAKNRDRIKKSYILCMADASVLGLVLGALSIVFGRQFLSIFTSDGAVIEAGMRRLSTMGLCYCICALMDSTIAASRALGKTFAPTVIVIMGSCVFRIAWIYTVFARFHTLSALYLLYFFSWTITSAAEIAYFIRTWKKLFPK